MKLLLSLLLAAAPAGAMIRIKAPAPAPIRAPQASLGIAPSATANVPAPLSIPALAPLTAPTLPSAAPRAAIRPARTDRESPRAARKPAVRASLDRLAATPARIPAAAATVRLDAVYQGKALSAPSTVAAGPVRAWSPLLRAAAGDRRGRESSAPAPAYPETPLAKPFEYRPGMTADDLPGRTPLEKHFAFFDTKGDGLLTVWRTRSRLREIGFGALEAAGTAAGIHAAIRALLGSYLPTPRMGIRVADAARVGRQGTFHVYDAAGNIDEAAFRRLTAASTLGGYKDAGGRDQAGSYLTESALLGLVEENLRREDPGAAQNFGNRREWRLMFEHFSDGTVSRQGRTERVMTVETLRKLYDGRLFYEKMFDELIRRSEARKARR